MSPRLQAKDFRCHEPGENDVQLSCNKQFPSGLHPVVEESLGKRVAEFL